MGLIRSILSFGTNATTELVPKMNIAAMMGTAMITDRPMDLAAPRHSPASIAIESKPLRAPKLILPSRFKVSTEIAGSERVKGGYTDQVGYKRRTLITAERTAGCCRRL